MENNLQIFEDKQFGKIRTLTIDGEPWFVGKDVATALKYSNTRDALVKHVDEDDKKDGVAIRDSIGREQQAVVINESGMYALIFGSKLPKAREFKHWVTSEVLPSIRKNGIYATPAAVDSILNDPDAWIRLLQEYKAVRDENAVLNQQVATLLPKANYCDVVLNCSGLVDTTLIAKDYGMSAKAFNKLLNQLGIQYKSNGVWYLYQQFAPRGWTKVTTAYTTDTRGERYAFNYTQWTQKGRYELYKILKRNGYLPMIEIKG